jgi:hypothetical protein
VIGFRLWTSSACLTRLRVVAVLNNGAVLSHHTATTLWLSVRVAHATYARRRAGFDETHALVSRVVPTCQATQQVPCHSTVARLLAIDHHCSSVGTYQLGRVCTAEFQAHCQHANRDRSNVVCLQGVLQITVSWSCHLSTVAFGMKLRYVSVRNVQLIRLCVCVCVCVCTCREVLVCW